MQVNTAPKNHEFDKSFLDYLRKLSNKFSPAQKKFIRGRQRRLDRARTGHQPGYRGPSNATVGNWQIKLPSWLQDQRNQMTGPADNTKLVTQLLNSNSPGVMLDLEDSMANNWENLLVGYSNIKKALYGKISYNKNGQTVSVNSKCRENTVVFTRVRGLHLGQIIPTRFRVGQLISASVFDLAMLTYDLDVSKLQHPLCFYIPKSESSREAKWWSQIFSYIERLKRWPQGTIKCMALVESYPLAYEIEEFIYELRRYIVGLNLGRWDYMASLFDYRYNDPDWLFPDRNSIPVDAPFFQNLRKRMVEICHKRGILAIGGMSALYPDRKNKKFNDIAQKKLKLDKLNESNVGMDGAWTGHPDQNDIAVLSFPEPNQLNVRYGSAWVKPNLSDKGPAWNKPTQEGTREAVRVCIQYRQGVLSGKGASLINGYMEDLATDRIYRIIITQRLDRGVYTEEELKSIFVDETGKLIEKYPDVNWLQGRDATWNLIQTRQFNPR